MNRRQELINKNLSVNKNTAESTKLKKSLEDLKWGIKTKNILQSGTQIWLSLDLHAHNFKQSTKDKIIKNSIEYLEKEHGLILDKDYYLNEDSLYIYMDMQITPEEYETAFETQKRNNTNIFTRIFYWLADMLKLKEEL